jgi:hypothetical protein
MNSGRDTPRGVGFPIRTSADQRSLASPRGFSQRATSFIASWRQGIHRTPLSRSAPPKQRPAQPSFPPTPARRTKSRPHAELRQYAVPDRIAEITATRLTCLQTHVSTLCYQPFPSLRLKEHAARQNPAGSAPCGDPGSSGQHWPDVQHSPAGRLPSEASRHDASEGNGGDRIRTDDPLLAKQVLYQLSYAPAGPSLASDATHRGPDVPQAGCAKAPTERLWRPWAREDLNLRPHAYQACALTN